MRSLSLLGVSGIVTIVLGLALLASGTGALGSSRGSVANEHEQILIGGILVTLVGILIYGSSVYIRRFPVPQEVSL